jgi:hypothetical protein
MSSSNVIGADWGGFPLTAQTVTYGTATLPNGAGPNVVSAAIPVPFLQSTDYVRLSWIAGSAVLGPITTPVTNPGLANASFQIQSGLAVTAVNGSLSATYRWEVVKSQ